MTLTKGERDELKSLTNERAKLEMTRLKALAAARLVELNDQLEQCWSEEDFKISQQMDALRKGAEALNATIDAECEKQGILPELRPRILTGFIRAGTDAERRNRLRQLAKDQNAAALAQAQHAVDTWKLETRTALVRQGLTDEGAHWLVENIPSPDKLLPRVSVDQLLAELSTQSEQRARRQKELVARYEPQYRYGDDDDDDD